MSDPPAAPHEPDGDHPQGGRAVVHPRSVCIVGAGLSGLRTAAELRAQGFTGTLTVVGAESLAPYDRPPLSKELFTRPSPLWLAEEGYGDLTVLADRVLLGRSARALRADDGGATLTLDDGAVVHADVVVLATGSHAVVPPGWSGVLTLHEAPDADVLRAALRPGTRLVVVGAGWIGAEVAGVAAARGVDVTVLEAAPTPLHRQIGAELGARTVPWYEAAGIDLRCGVAVTGVRARSGAASDPEDGAVPAPNGTGAVTGTGTGAGAGAGTGTVTVTGAGTGAGTGTEITLADGERIVADTVLVAVGARPATGWLAGTLPLTARGAVPVDHAGRVLGGPASVRAVGDCADMNVPGLGEVPGGHWDGALTHPTALVAGLLGGEVAPPAAPYVFSTQLDHDLAFVGTPGEGSELLLREDGAGWTALFVEDEVDEPGAARLVAGFTVDHPRDVGPLRRLLAGGGRPVLDRERAADPAVAVRKAVR